MDDQTEFQRYYEGLKQAIAELDEREVNNVLGF